MGQRTYQPHGPPTANARKSVHTPLDSALSDVNSKKKDKNKKKKEKEKEKQKQSVPLSSKTVQGLVKVEQQRQRLDKLLLLLLDKKPFTDVEDATHLLHRRARVRGRPPKLSGTTSK